MKLMKNTHPVLLFPLVGVVWKWTTTKKWGEQKFGWRFHLAVIQSCCMVSACLHCFTICHMYPFIHSFVHSFIHPFFLPPIHSSIYPNSGFQFITRACSVNNKQKCEPLQFLNFVLNLIAYIHHKLFLWISVYLSLPFQSPRKSVSFRCMVT